MIGGRVLDTSALIAFARGTSIYAAAAVWTAVEESIVLIVPSTAVAAAWANLAEKHHPVLDVLLHLPVTVIDNLDESRAKTIGQLGGAQADAHAIACALDRRWPLLTTDPAQYTAYRDLGVDFEPLTQLPALDCTSPVHGLDAHKNTVEFPEAGVYQIREISLQVIDPGDSRGAFRPLRRDDPAPV